MQIFNPAPFTSINSQDYLLVISPNEEVTTAVKEFKRIAKQLIGPFPSFNSKAHITVNHYYDRNALYFDDRVATYRNMISRISSFDISVDGFGYFEHQNTYTIYAKIDLDPDITTTFFKFRKVFGADVRNTPHITIARGLTFEQFKTLWNHFKNLKFQCSFYTEEIVVLKAPLQQCYNHLPMEIQTVFQLKKVL
ncbi:MAG: hypothetical protein EOP42_18045 [Sphingobacteriaceae bacterium]|nr:MAG: hypothetical protein EOP42_18045 [Sphingobacteriaceae bacterium]